MGSATRRAVLASLAGGTATALLIALTGDAWLTAIALGVVLAVGVVHGATFHAGYHLGAEDARNGRYDAALGRRGVYADPNLRVPTAVSLAPAAPPAPPRVLRVLEEKHDG